MFEFLLSIVLTSQHVSSVQPKLTDTSLDISISQLPIVNNVNNIIDSGSYLAVDEKNNTVLFQKKSNQQLPVASLTKLMTVLLILENHKLNESVLISKKAASTIWSKIWFYVWDELTVLNAVKASLIKSWNDSAVALAEHHSWSVDKFVIEMNKRAKELNMINTHFQNPHGLDEENHYSSAHDILILTKQLWKYDIFKKIVNTKQTVIKTESWRSIKLKNTNKLLSNHIKWIKTWTTEKAGQCLVLYVDKEDKQFFTIVLWSHQRFSDSTKFINTIWKHTKW